MKKLHQLVLVATLMFAASIVSSAQTQVCGTVYLELYDSYGDGWNGNEIDVKFTGGDSTYTLSSGSFISIPLSVNYLDTAEFVWQNGGSYTSECTYKVTDAAGTVLYSSPTGNNMTIGSTQYTAYCATPPVPQMCGTVYLELYDSYGDGWNGNEIDVSFTGGDSTFTMSSGSFVSYALTIPYQDTAHFIWQNGGSYTSECTYKVTDAYGTVLYSSPTGNNMTIGSTQYSLQCNSLASCIAPTNLSVTTGVTDAALSFDGTSSYAYHLVEYDTAGFAPGTGDTMWVYADTAYITGLMPATSYDFYVTTLCSASDSSAATASLGQFTQCAALATPYSENFDASTTGSASNPSLPQCWDFYTNTSSSFYYPYVYNRNYSFYANSGSNFLYAYRSSSSSSSSSYADTTMAIMPEIQGLDSATKQLKFYARTTSVGRPGEVIIGLTDAAGTPSSLKIVDTVYAPTTTYSQYTVYLDGATTGDARVALVFMRQIGTYDNVCIDDVEISDIPPCPEPIGLSLASATRTSATINWSSSSAAFDIEVGPMGFTQGTGTSYTSTTNSVTATNLMQNTYYDAYVRSNCTSSGKGNSPWTGPFTFKTECGWFPTPYSEDFGYSDGSGSSSNPDLPDCWIHANTSAYQYNYAYVDNNSVGNPLTNNSYLYLRSYYSQYNSSTAIGDTNAIILPMMSNLLSGMNQLNITAKPINTSNAYNAKLAIGTVDTTGDLSSLVIIDTIEVTEPGYTNYSLDLTGVSSNGGRIAIVTLAMVNSGYTYGYNGAYIDQINVVRLLPCPTPENVRLNYATATNASLSWSGKGGTDFNIIYSRSGFGQATGTSYSSINDSTILLTGLIPDATYDVIIQNDCSNVGDSLSYWSNKLTFTTKCEYQPLPIIEDFESSNIGSSLNDSVPQCWDYVRTGNYAYSAYGYVQGNSSNANSGSNSFYMYASSNSSYSDTAILISPNFGDISSKSVVLDMAVRTSYISSSYNSQLYVMALDSMNNIVDSLSRIDITQSFQNTDFNDVSIRLDSMVNVHKLGLMVKNNGASQFINIDDIFISEITDCYYVQDFQVDSIGTDMAQFSWDHRFSDSVVVTVVPSGLAKLNGTEYHGSNGMLTVTGLIPAAEYDVYYEEYCGGQLSGYEKMETITMLSNSAQAPCEVVFNLYDSYGDGWNGGEFGYRLWDYSAGILDSGTISMSSGSFSTLTISTNLLYQTDSVEIYHISGGSYPSEISMSIYNGSGVLLDSVSGGGYFTDFNVSPGCSGSLCFASTLNITTAENYAVLEFNEDSVRYSLQGIGTQLDSTNIEFSNDSSTTITGLVYYTGYQLFYQTPCSSGGWTPWAVKFLETECDPLDYSYGTSTTNHSCNELLFSEYIEGSSNNKGFEIYNPSDSAISLSNYTVYLNGNGGSFTNSFNSNDFIAAGDVYVVVTNQADTSMQIVADTALSFPSVAHFNGDDALILVHSGDTIDVIGTPGIDPGSSWTVDSGSTANHTLVRKSSVNYGSTDWSTGSGEWEVFPQNTYYNLGSHNYTCIPVVDSSQNTDLCYGDDIQFALAGDAIAESFEWIHEGSIIATTTIPSLTLTSVTPNESGEYSVMVSNRCGSQEISLGEIMVKDTISISAVTSVNTCLDLDAELIFTTSGPIANKEFARDAIPYSWSSDSIIINNVSYSDSGNYQLTISNSCETKSAQIALKVIEGTTITSTSPETYVCTDSTEAIYVSGLGNSLQYQWSKDGTTLPNSNNDTLSVTSPADTALYTVQVSGICSADTSKVSIANSSVLILKRQSSEITTSQSDLVLCEGDQIDLGFEAVGHNLQYAWLKDGALITGASDTTYTLGNAMNAASGTYQFAISGTCGVDTSAEIDVNVRKATSYLSGMSDIEVCVGDQFTMPLSYDGHDVTVSTHKVGSTNSIPLVSSTVSGCTELFFSEYIEGSSNNKGFEIFNPSSTVVSLAGYSVYLSVNGGSVTNSFSSNAVIAPGDVYVITTNQASSLMQAEADTVLSFPSVAHFNGDDALILMNGTDTIDVIGTPGIDPGSSWTVGSGSTKDRTLVRKVSISSGSTDWNTGANEWDVYAKDTYSYLGAHSFNCPNNITSNGFGLSNISYNDEGYYYAKFDGSCGTVYSDTIYVTVHTTTAITSTYANPLNVICEDASIDFAFSVEGHALTYAWNHDGIAAGTDSLLSISSADTSGSGFYQLITSGTCGTDTSQSVQLIVHPETRALTSVVDTSICQDASISIPVTTDGYNVTYKWYQDGSLISTSSSLSITNAMSSDNGEYLLALDGYCGTDSISSFDVFVMPTTEVISSLGDTTMCLDDTHVLAVVDTGFMNTYQWYKDGAILSGETDSTLNISAIAATDTGAYTLVASGSCGTDSSAVIELHAWQTTTMLSESNSFDICKGDQATMFLEAKGDFLTYSWTKDGFTLPGSTNDTLVLNNVQPAFAGYFIGTASGICGTVSTDTITMSVHQVPNVVQEPISDTLCQFDSTALTVNATGFGVVYDWYFNNALVGSGPTLVLDSIVYAQQGDYVAIADGYCGVDSSQLTYVKVDAILPTTTAPSLSFEICELDTIVLNASSLLGQSVNVNWFRDSVLVGSNATYNLTDSGMYHVVLTDINTGCIESTPQIEVIERPVPQPVQIYGEDTLLTSLPSWYWVQAEPQVDYSWSIPTGIVQAGWFTDSVEIKFSGSGTHMVYMQAENQFECTTDLELMVLISGIGIQEGQDIAWRLYPNPTIGWILLEFEEALASEVTLEIVDLKGALISKETIEKGAAEYRIDLANLEGGQYLIVIPELQIRIPVVKAD